MGAVLLTPDASMGVSPTLAVPLSQPRDQGSAMHATARAPSRFAVWRTLESRADALASWGALAVGLLAAVAYVLV
jgi:hypothetical protein